MPPHATHKTGTVSASDSHTIKAPVCRTEILVRLWTRTGDGKKLLPDEANAKRSGAIAFIEDLIASRGGSLVSTDDGLFVSILGSPADALVVSRQILLGMRGFQDKSGDHPVSVSISIDASLQGSSSDVTRAEIFPESSEINTSQALQVSHDLSSLIRISRPAQVLLTHDLSLQVSTFNGLPLKAFEGRFGVVEYMWTSAEKLLEFQNQQSGFVDLLEVAKVEETTALLAPSQSPSTAMETYFEPRAKTPFGSEETQTTGWKKALRTPWAIAAAATLVAALAVAGGVALRGKKSDPGPRTNPVNQGSIQIPQPRPKTPEAQTPVAKKRPPTKQETSVVAEGAQPAHQVISKTKVEPEPDSARTVVPPPPRTECKLTGDLQSYIRVAEGYRGHGQYEDAKRVFTQVIACDPNNQDAHKGLERTLAATAQ